MKTSVTKGLIKIALDMINEVGIHGTLQMSDIKSCRANANEIFVSLKDGNSVGFSWGLVARHISK